MKPEYSATKERLIASLIKFQFAASRYIRELDAKGCEMLRCIKVVGEIRDVMRLEAKLDVNQ